MPRDIAVVIRRLMNHERVSLALHLKGLNGRDRYLRFGRAGVTDQCIDTYVAGIAADDLILGAFVGGQMVGAAHVVLVGDIAELAGSVDARYRSAGIGTELYDNVVVFARNRRVRKIVACWLPENKPMLALARRVGMEACHHDGDVETVIHLPPPDPLTIGKELAAAMPLFLSGWFAGINGSLQLEALPWLPWQFGCRQRV